VIYLDNNATTRPSPAVVEAVCRALTDLWPNPSSMHRAGQTARQAVELARREVATLIGARAREITFTSSGTESIDLAIRGAIDASGRRTIVTTAVEHGAVRELAHDLEQRGLASIRWAPLDRHGAADPEALADLLDDSVAVVSIQWANNETGVVHPVARIGTLCRERNLLFHCDGTQWVGKMPTNVGTAAPLARTDPGTNGHARRTTGDNESPVEPTPIDILTFSPHKFHGPKGIGIVWTRRGVRLKPQIHGTQELGRRGGTENVPGIVGAGVACREADEWLADPDNLRVCRARRDRFERTVAQRIPGAVINGPRSPDGRVWNTASIGFPRLEAEALLLLMSERGLCASAGSACASGSLEASPVLTASGIAPEVAHGTIRFSICRHTTDDEIDRAVNLIAECVEVLSRSMAASGRGA